MSKWRYNKKTHSIFEGRKELCGFGSGYDAIAEWFVAEHNKSSAEIFRLRRELNEISIQLNELYDKTCNTTPPEIYASILGLHERLDIALQDKPK